MEVKDGREPLRRPERLMGVNQGTAEVSWSVFFIHSFFYADCPTRPICQRTLKRLATKEQSKIENTDSGSNIAPRRKILYFYLYFNHFSLIRQS